LQRVGLWPETPQGTRYHGFISYSHAADGKLAPALQRSLQLFAKPWYRTRALHIFRDDAALAANPQLWGSIEVALGESEHLILLASPQAAASEWVDREAHFWRRNKGVERILIVLTDGEPLWNGEHAGDTRVRVLPPTLDGAFSDEPRYVDLRWAQHGEDLTLTHPRWLESIADLAAPLHGKPKDELSSEEVRQHRRTKRVVRSAVTVLAALTAAAVTLSVLAYTQYRSAQAAALAAQATADLTSDPEQSLSLALQATQANASPAAVQALRSAVAGAPERVAIDSGGKGNARAAWSPSGEVIAVSGASGGPQLWNARTGRITRTLAAAGDGSPYSQLQFSPDGTWLAAVTQRGAVDVWNVVEGTAAATGALNQEVRDAYSLGGSSIQGGVSLLGTTLVWDRSPEERLLVYGFGIGRVFTLNPDSGVVDTLTTPPVSGTDFLVLSPDETKLVTAGESGGGTLTSSGAIVTRATGQMVPLQPDVEMGGHDACWFGDSQGFVTWDPTEAEDLALRWWNATSGAEVGVFPTSTTILAVACSPSPSQDWVATGDRAGTVMLHLTNGTTFRLTGHNRSITALAPSSDGNYLATASGDGTARIWDTRTGEQLRLLPDGNALTNVQFNPDGGLAMTLDQQGVVRLWDTGIGEPITALARLSGGETYPLGFANGDRLVYGLNADPSQAGPGAPITITSASLVEWDARSGTVVRRVPLPADIWTAASQAPCGAFVPSGCRLPPAGLAVPLPVPSQYVFAPVGVAVSSDGGTVAYSDATGVGVRSVEGTHGTQISFAQRPVGLTFAAGRLVVMTQDSVYVVKPVAGARPMKLPQSSAPMDVQVSADGTRLVTGDLDGTVTVWSTTSSTPLGRFHVDRSFESQVKQLSGGTATPSMPAPIPLRVAISADGSEVAAGTSWQTVFVWKVAGQHRLGATIVSAPSQTGSGGPGTETSGGFIGPWAIAELAFSRDGSSLIAVDFPYYSASDSTASAIAEVLTTSGTEVIAYQSGELAQGAIAPGVALSPAGDAVVAGVLNVSPSADHNSNAVYEVASGQVLLNLATARIPATGDYYDWPSIAQPWAANGIDVIAGGAAVYACDACGSLAQLQATAQTRLAWKTPLSPAHDVPPPGDPYA
jgi:WD40 repeat protein